MRRKYTILLVCGIILLLGIITAALFYFGILQFNNPPRETYPVRGVDVSHYQGEINWSVLCQQDIRFAFIKATEGSTYVDNCFEANYAAAIQTDLRVGAYHFFSFDSPGATQANNFITTVSAYDDMLPPVVDVEFYGKYISEPPSDIETLQQELSALLNALENHYGIKPILYATQEAYDLLLKDDFSDYDLWIRNVLTTPAVDGWTFWQYSNRGRLDGYIGEEFYIDLNVFRGTIEEFQSYGKPTA